MGTIDIIVLLVTAVSILFALYRGLVRELLGITSWILAALAALYSYEPVQPLLGRFFDSPKVAGLVGSICVALFVLVVMTIINAAITSRLRKSALSGLDRILGFAFGVFRAFLLLALVYIGSSMMMSKAQIKHMEEENYSLSYIQIMANWLEYLLPAGMREDLKAYEQTPPDAKEMSEKIKKKIVVPVAEYNKKDRESLDDMIEDLVEIEGID